MSSQFFFREKISAKVYYISIRCAQQTQIERYQANTFPHLV